MSSLSLRERIKLAWLVLTDSDKVKMQRTRRKARAPDPKLPTGAELEKSLLENYPDLPEPPKINLAEVDAIMRKKRERKMADWTANLHKPKEPPRFSEVKKE